MGIIYVDQVIDQDIFILLHQRKILCVHLAACFRRFSEKFIYAGENAVLSFFSMKQFLGIRIFDQKIGGK